MRAAAPVKLSEDIKYGYSIFQVREQKDADLIDVDSRPLLASSLCWWPKDQYTTPY